VRASPLADLYAAAEALDAVDPLAGFLDRFEPSPPGRPPLIYLDGNSLGPPPRGVTEAVAEELRRWREDLIGGWNERWLGLGEEAAGLLAPVLGADRSSIWVGDSTSVNLAKVVGALQAASGRLDLVSAAGEFSTDRYLLDEAARRAGGSLRLARSADPTEVATLLDRDVAVVSLSAVDFRTGELADLASVTELAHRHGAAVVWDCSHAAGVIPLDLEALGADAAVGCTYKYLNGGPGAPAWLYVRPDLVAELRNPLPGWFGHRRPFAFEDRYEPADGIGRFAVGTPAVLSLAAALPGLALAAEAGVHPARSKSLALTQLLLDATASALAPVGFLPLTPADPRRRGSQVSLRHPEAWRVCQLAVRQLGVCGDFREPDVLRLGCAPLALRHRDVVEAADRLARAVGAGDHRRHPNERRGVT
jgi:kynureninase